MEGCDGRRRVVLVDDEDGVRKMLRRHLERRGCEVVAEAANGRAALKTLQDVVCDVVVMDFRMPELDGVRATRELAGRRPGVEVVGFSNSDEARQAFLDAGASRCFSKLDVPALVAYVAGDEA